MKLELKHLDFVNNGIVKLSRQPHWVFDNVKLQDCQLSFSSTINEPYLRYRDVTFSMDQIIPYKRPISDLTKEIEVDGEKFVPITIVNLMYEVENRNNFPLSMYIDASWVYSVKMLPCDLVEKLLEWHFDIYNLIPNGLAIDINTLK